VPVNPMPAPKKTDQVKSALARSNGLLAVVLAILAGYAAATPVAIVAPVLAAAALAALGGRTSR
jgi:hypothetical protein